MEGIFRVVYVILYGQAAERVRLKFTPALARWVGKGSWQHDQTDENLEDGSYSLEVPYSNDQELVMDLLRHSPEVEILEPAELRLRLHTALCAAAKKHLPKSV